MFVSSQMCESVPQNKNMHNVGLRYEVRVGKKRKNVSYWQLPLDFSSMSDGVKKRMAVTSWIASVSKKSNIPETGTPVAELLQGVQKIIPATALDHEARCGHSVTVRADTLGGKRIRFLLDYPMPIQLDCRTWRCSACRNTKRSGEKVFPVLHSDITLRFPGSVVYVSKHYGVTYMSRMFLLNQLSMIY